MEIEMQMNMVIGTKVLFASEPMTRAEYCAYRGWAVPAEENGADAGRLVEYTDGSKGNHPDHGG